ncbi:MAG: tRNA guanosine(34) transglycosylase Tgt [Planctomycetes bacterium]|nr:tRNA guanosine(34) transglycosylase Tgt [Planctomycetota bacterium]
MTEGFAFSVRHTCGRARCGAISTPHGSVKTPAFMPVGTRAAVKGLTPAQVEDTNTQIVLANTYHLMLRPGAETVAQAGGLHAFMAWDRPILTDSGGFQVFSLADLRQIDDNGVAFRSHIDGAPVKLTPESSIEVQNLLGADIIMAFDECPPLPTQADTLRTAVRRTVAWARRCRAAHRRADQALYGIVQCGLDVGLRRECLEQLLETGFDGYALGGLSVGEPPLEMRAFLDEFAHELPADQPRYLMGVGTPADLVAAVASGIDQFDCVLPTRNGRKAYAYTSAGILRLRNARHRAAREPLDPACGCYTCRRFSRAYLRHLFMSGEVLGATLVSLHNITFYQSLMRQMRAALEAGTFATWRETFSASPACRPHEEDE